MAQPPSTVEQLIFLVLLVLPGVTYQFVRQRYRGPVPGESELAERVLRAMTASIALDTLYAIAFGPQLVSLVRGRAGWFTGLAERPREAGLWALVLFLGIPAGAAIAVSQWERRGSRSRFRPIPTAWDYAFRNRGTQFVRARLKDGAWIGGWYGSSSYVSGYPHSRDIYLQWAYQMDVDGSFRHPVEGTAGIYVRLDDVDILEFVDHPGLEEQERGS